MKRFEIAVEISKQLLALSSAVFVAIAALSGSILNYENDWRVFTALVWVYILLLISIVFGILHLGAVTNLAETAERRASENSGNFVSLFDTKAAPITLIFQQITFLLSMIVVVVALLIDRSVYREHFECFACYHSNVSDL